MRTLHVLEPGLLTTVQDLGRPGLAALGVGRSGAVDRGALRLANRLVGNPEAAAALEVTTGGLRLRAEQPVLIAVTGAPCRITLSGATNPAAAANAPFWLAAGAVLALHRPDVGLRSYVAVRGGIAVDPVLGSRATDTLSGLGPPALRRGDQVPVGVPAGEVPAIDLAPPLRPRAGMVELRVVPGPRADWFTGSALEVLCTEAYEVHPDSDRVAMRLAGAAVSPVRQEELPSEGLVAGAVQVPPSGAPVLFLADHPVTGGYPVLAVVLDADVDAAAQARPGQRLRFRRVSLPRL